MCHDIVVDTVDIENMFILPHEIFTCSYLLIEAN